MRALLIFLLFLTAAVPGFRYWAKHHKTRHKQEEVTNQCAYRFPDGKRCANGRWPMSKFCPAHGGAAKTH